MAEPQTSNAVVMVRPAAFGFHADAAASNAFANAAPDDDLNGRARREFDGLAERLAQAGVNVLILEDSPEVARPDAIFPNNWFSTHADGTLVLYPMATRARRLERRPEELCELFARHGFKVERIVDLSGEEAEGRFLEGTGSLVLDRPRRRAFATPGPRTHAKAVADFDRELGYRTFLFDARDRAGRPIYHTNVLLSLGSRFAALCIDAVAPEHRRPLIEEIGASERTVIDIDYDQMRRFGCNIIELRGSGGPVIALSAAAKACLRPDQIGSLQELGGELVDSPIPTIEAVGGGSVRCMIAEVHLPRIKRV